MKYRFKNPSEAKRSATALAEQSETLKNKQDPRSNINKLEKDLI